MENSEKSIYLKGENDFLHFSADDKKCTVDYTIGSKKQAKIAIMNDKGKRVKKITLKTKKFTYQISEPGRYQFVDFSEGKCNTVDFTYMNGQIHCESEDYSTYTKYKPLYDCAVKTAKQSSAYNYFGKKNLEKYFSIMAERPLRLGECLNQIMEEFLSIGDFDPLIDLKPRIFSELLYKLALSFCPEIHSCSDENEYDKFYELFGAQKENEYAV
jgi:hypothetical protein